MPSDVRPLLERRLQRRWPLAHDQAQIREPDGDYADSIDDTAYAE